MKYFAVLMMILFIEVNPLPILRKLTYVQKHKTAKDSILMRKLLTIQASGQAMLKTELDETIKPDVAKREIPSPNDPFREIPSPNDPFSRVAQFFERAFKTKPDETIKSDGATREIPSPNDPFSRVAQFFERPRNTRDVPEPDSPFGQVPQFNEQTLNRGQKAKLQKSSNLGYMGPPNDPILIENQAMLKTEPEAVFKSARVTRDVPEPNEPLAQVAQFYEQTLKGQKEKVQKSNSLGYMGPLGDIDTDLE